MNNYKIANGQIVLQDAILQNHSLIVKDKTIVDITTDDDHYSDIETVDAQGAYVTPSLVELHIHGCSHYGFDTVEEADVYEAIEFLKKRGINTFVPTFICDRAIVKRFCNILANSPALQKYIPGIYIEGPFVNINKKGGIIADTIHKPNLDVLKQIIAETRGLLKLMTIAPEMQGNHQVFHHLLQNNIVPCFGHSNATIADVYQTQGHNINITHLFNAMSGISHKTNGLAMLPFIDRNIFFELNGDGVHVNNEILQMCYKHLNHDKLILISDAVISAGLEPGEHDYFGRTVISGKHGVRYKDGNVLMGSQLLINDVLKRFLKLTGAPLHEGIRFASYNPSRLLGISDKKGSIEPGKDADLLLLDRNFNVVRNLNM
ncbi:N-acetylglucosamine 6-phosphate deacetylase [Saccharicrinis carchari]|uniref:N-acetylglucosamine 6-phosphate deacetylase n=1 Tax=Saccharicrinis carchari TaxID=1168039 RepID=A0A521CZM1_SACCC|nr:N-acetylglucosamine-6-phosphate deacetylase [Saccharicrinis carchari]SMO64191.1 N-acetylglucosamine 6-phosphate deacetylase [Saccharicrinis carchari]